MRDEDAALPVRDGGRSKASETSALPARFPAHLTTRLPGVVAVINNERNGWQEISVQVADSEELRRAIVYTKLVGSAAVGDKVLLNTVAVEMGLGTGGYDFVVAGNLREHDAPGHLLKLRYTPLQIPVLAVESPESPYHAAIANFDDLRGLPVVCAELHSQLPAVCVGACYAFQRLFDRSPRIAYIMTDGAALPLAFSRLVPQLKERNLLAATITAGQAFGGDYEAINIYSALAAAKAVIDADIVFIGQGPGNAGTGTSLGFSGIDAGMALNAAAALGGTPIFAPRLSFAEERERHRGLSYHSRTILTRIVLRPVLVSIPRLPALQSEIIIKNLSDCGIFDLHPIASANADESLSILENMNLNVTTMGRTIEQERAFFLASVAAGILASQMVRGNELRGIL